MPHTMHQVSYVTVMDEDLCVDIRQRVAGLKAEGFPNGTQRRSRIRACSRVTWALENIFVFHRDEPQQCGAIAVSIRC